MRWFYQVSPQKQTDTRTHSCTSDLYKEDEYGNTATPTTHNTLLHSSEPVRERLQACRRDEDKGNKTRSDEEWRKKNSKEVETGLKKKLKEEKRRGETRKKTKC